MRVESGFRSVPVLFSSTNGFCLLLDSVRISAQDTPRNQMLTNPQEYPILLTSWHLVFATIMTQIMARTTTLLDGRKTVKMTGRVYLRAIVPIGVFFSLSLICGNLTYLYLSVSFIQMLKVCRFGVWNLAALINTKIRPQHPSQSSLLVGALESISQTSRSSEMSP